MCPTIEYLLSLLTHLYKKLKKVDRLYKKLKKVDRFIQKIKKGSSLLIYKKLKKVDRFSVVCPTIDTHTPYRVFPKDIRPSKLRGKPVSPEGERPIFKFPPEARYDPQNIDAYFAWYPLEPPNAMIPAGLESKIDLQTGEKKVRRIRNQEYYKKVRNDIRKQR